MVSLSEGWSALYALSANAQQPELAAGQRAQTAGRITLVELSSHGALWRHNVSIDVIFSDSALSGYDLVIAPMLHMVKPGLGERVEAFVAGWFFCHYSL